MFVYQLLTAVSQSQSSEVTTFQFGKSGFRITTMTSNAITGPDRLKHFRVNNSRTKHRGIVGMPTFIMEIIFPTLPLVGITTGNNMLTWFMGVAQRTRAHRKNCIGCISPPPHKKNCIGCTTHPPHRKDCICCMERFPQI